MTDVRQGQIDLTREAGRQTGRQAGRRVGVVGGTGVCVADMNGAFCGGDFWIHHHLDFYLFWAGERMCCVAL